MSSSEYITGVLRLASHSVELWGLFLMPLRRKFISAITIHIYVKVERLAVPMPTVWNRPRLRSVRASFGNEVRIFYKSREIWLLSMEPEPLIPCSSTILQEPSHICTEVPNSFLSYPQLLQLQLLLLQLPLPLLLWNQLQNLL